MLHRLAIEESETDSMASYSASERSSLDISDRVPSMSTVYSDQSLPPRPASPSSSSISSKDRKHSFPLPFRKNSNSSSDTQEKKKREDGLSRWLRDGTVVYKSVGLGLMDLVVGTHLVNIAKEKNMGTQIHNF